MLLLKSFHTFYEFFILYLVKRKKIKKSAPLQLSLCTVISFIIHLVQKLKYTPTNYKKLHYS